MLSGKGTVLISQKQNEYLTYQIYDHKPEYIQTLNQAALELGYDSLISYLKKNSSPIEFNSLALYTCTEELMDLKPNSKLMISEDYQIFFFTELNDIKNLAIEKALELSPLPKTRKAYEILLKLKHAKNLIIPSHTDPHDDDYCLGLSYYSSEGEASGELWHDFTKKTSGTFQGLTEEYFFTNNTESNIYNHSGKKYGFYISQDDLSIRYLERDGALDEFQLSAWREEVKEKSLLYFLGLQHVESVHGSYSRRSAFIFNSKNELIMHYRTTEIGASHIADYIRIRLNDDLERMGEDFSNIKILLADGDHNAQTHIPDEAFSDERLNSYGFHFILRPFIDNIFEQSPNTTETSSSQIFQDTKARSVVSSNLVKNLQKKLALLNPFSILSGFWRYRSNPKELLTRIKNNISILSLSGEIVPGRREFEFKNELTLSQVESFLLNKKSLENFPHKSLISLITESLIYVEDFKINLKEIYRGYYTYVLDEQSHNKKRLYLKTTKDIKPLNTEHEVFHHGLLEQEKDNSNLKPQTQKIYQEVLNQSTLKPLYRKETEFQLAKLLFGFDSNHKLTSNYGMRDKHPVTNESSFHHGVDYNALREQTIYAPIDLKFHKSDFNDKLGNYLIAEVLADHSSSSALRLDVVNLYILCAHLNEIPDYKTDQIILKNSPLCKAGNTGLSTAPHLHLETRFTKMWDLYFEARSIDPIIVFYYLLNQQ
jgi:murein DD-endopeptidase MepM/ murein hydrolase activator NlpD